MKYVVTLVGKMLDDDIIGVVGAAAGSKTAPDWLAPGLACDIYLDGPIPDDIEGRISAVLAGAPVDNALQLADLRRRRLLVADMDSTIITVECIDEMADVLGLKPQVAAITERAMRGELDFADALRERVGLLRGLETAALQQVYDDRIELTAGARTLVMTMRQHGAYTALVSGGFLFFTAQVARAAGFHEDRANELNIGNGRLDGTVHEPILGADAKREALETLAHAHGLSLDETLAVGDGANDLMMLQRAGLGVAFRAKPAVAAAAGARVDHNDLTALLYFQGYRQKDFVG